MLNIHMSSITYVLASSTSLTLARLKYQNVVTFGTASEIKLFSQPNGNSDLTQI